jgi:hypothetical protein
MQSLGVLSPEILRSTLCEALKTQQRLKRRGNPSFRAKQDLCAIARFWRNEIPLRPIFLSCHSDPRDRPAVTLRSLPAWPEESALKIEAMSCRINAHPYPLLRNFSLRLSAARMSQVRFLNLGLWDVQGSGACGPDVAAADFGGRRRLWSAAAQLPLSQLKHFEEPACPRGFQPTQQ